MWFSNSPITAGLLIRQCTNSLSPLPLLSVVSNMNTLHSANSLKVTALRHSPILRINFLMDFLKRNNKKNLPFWKASWVSASETCYEVEYRWPNFDIQEEAIVELLVMGLTSFQKRFSKTCFWKTFSFQEFCVVIYKYSYKKKSLVLYALWLMLWWIIGDVNYICWTKNLQFKIINKGYLCSQQLKKNYLDLKYYSPYKNTVLCQF